MNDRKLYEDIYLGLNQLNEVYNQAAYNLSDIELACDRALDYPFDNWTEETLHNFINQVKYLAEKGQNK